MLRPGCDDATERFVAALFIGVLLVTMPLCAQNTPVPSSPFGETIEVRRIITEVRVVTHDGHPVVGLGPNDFSVRVGGRPAKVESVLWIPAGTELDAVAPPAQPSEFEDEGGPSILPPEGRLIVILFQYDFAQHQVRLRGLMRMAPRASEFVANLGPNDKVAVLVFGSHLELRVDFTSDHQSIAEMITAPEVLGGSFDPSKMAEPSLAEHLDPENARQAADLARALEIIGLALQEIPGTKSLVLFGYALGEMTARNRITHDDSYRKAMEALAAGRTSVFPLDITDADFHSLEKGLRTIARDTGGFYYKTNVFPDLAMRKLARVISSYYELSLIPPPGIGPEYIIKVRVDRSKTEVSVRQDHASPPVR